MSKMFSVKEVVWATEEVNKVSFKVRTHVVIKSGLPWKEAKELRKTSKNYEIFPEVSK
jgi:hypothetical protein